MNNNNNKENQKNVRQPEQATIKQATVGGDLPRADGVSLWCIHNALNRPKISNRKAVLKILEQYKTYPWFQVGDQDDKNVLTLDVGEFSSAEWPSAGTHDEKESGYWPDEEYGEHRFTEFLLALAPFLKSVLIIQAVSLWTNGEFGLAKQWTVWPAATDVEVKMIGDMGEGSINLVSGI